ncbi:MAG: DUF86 domain-containing protein [Lewinellaceae bacterium]|nr:DUF86 domain-containing protein [Lewinellaceae bacterium]
MPDKFGDKVRLQHVLDAIETIEGYVGDADFEAFSENSMMRDACIRQLQVVGESCRNVTFELREKNPEIPWKQIVGLRVIVIHEYFGVDENVIWEIIQNDLPSFKRQVEEIVENI